ncbi:polymer-forming cytoskeletal protein [Halostella sp. PRR32]|uniref:bactofilin family protein n=1 Tax=Halostella sp. PRR32 TaxID=3098147 RepID=UPI002B1D852B|nr:polymer-forming cytoskeletal protein [Halostella sp. PRR32]
MNRSRSAPAAVLALLVVLALLPGVAVAQETRSGDTVVVSADETVGGDLAAAGGTVIVRGTVTGDLTVAGGNVIIEGEVQGNVEAFSGNVRIAGDVGGDVTAAGGNVVIAENGTVSGTLEAAAGSVTVDGTVGAAEIASGSITLGSTAVVQSDLRYDGELTVAEGATIGGETIRDASIAPGPQPPRFAWAGTVYGFLTNLLLGALLLALLPSFSARVAGYGLNNPFRAGGFGLATLLIAPVLFVLLLVTIVGIPLAFVWLFLFLFLAWVGSVYGAYVVGEGLLSLTEIANRWLALVVGLVVVALVTQVPIAGGLFGLLVFLVGLGAFVGVLVGGYRRRRRGGAATDDPSVDFS